MTEPTLRPAPPEEAIARPRILPTLSAGFVIGFLEVALAISFAALVFSGPLAAFVPRGIGLALAGAVAGSIAIALLTSRPGTIGGNQDVPAAVLGTIAVAITSAVPGGTPQSYYTVVAAIILTTFGTGLFFWVIGRLQFGELVRFLPHPVVGGFLAGTGWLLLVGGVGLMAALPELGRPEALLRWLPGLLFGLFIYLIMGRSQHRLALPALLLAGTLLFFGLAALGGLSPAELSASGWLLGPFPQAALWQPILPADLALVQWPVILSQVPLMITIALISTVSLLLNTTGLELTINGDIDLNAELRAAGIGNLVSAPLGGLVGYQQLSLSALNFQIDAANRLTGLIAAAVCLIALLLGAAPLGYIPKMMAGGLLVYLGLSFLVPWAVRGWRTLPHIDYAIVVTILLITAVFGFLQAVGVGLLLAIILFVVSYSQIDVVRHELSGQTYQSRVTRPPHEEQVLRAAGEQTYILQLHGYIFFGTANQLLSRLRARLADASRPPLAVAIFDFERVTGLDSTAEISFRTMARLAEAHGFELHFAGVDAQTRRQLEQAGLTAVAGERLHFAPDLDRGVAFCEEAYLARAALAPPASLAAQLRALLPVDLAVDDLLGYFERFEVTAGDYVIREGENSEALYLLAAGQVTAQLARPTAPPVRLQTMGHGRLIGEIGFYLQRPRTADIVADEASVLYRLTRANLAHMEQTHPQAAMALHRLMINHLGERIINLTRTVRALEQ